MTRVAVVLDPVARAKLVNILGMLGSDFDGERASAGLLASRLLKHHGLRWDDLIPPAVGQIAEQSDHDVGSDLNLCLRHNAMLTDWERSFCVSLTTVRRLSPKQIGVLQRIAAALRDRGCR